MNPLLLFCHFSSDIFLPLKEAEKLPRIPKGEQKNSHILVGWNDLGIKALESHKKIKPVGAKTIKPYDLVTQQGPH